MGINMNIKLNELLTRLIILFSLVMLAFTGVIGINTSRYCLYLIVGLCIAKLYFLRINFSQLLTLGIVLLSCAITIALQTDNPANHLIFFTSLTLMVALYHDGIDEGSWKLLKLCTLIAAVCFIFQFQFQPVYDTMDRLLFSFDNPNMAGIVLCAPAMVLVLIAAEAHSIQKRLFHIALLAIMGYMIFITGNRSSFITVVLFTIVALLAMKKKPVRITNKAVYAILKLLPLVVMLVYVLLYSILPSDLVLWGKPFFSGREYAWKVALERLFSNPFAQYAYEEGTLNLILEGNRRYGILSMIGYLCLLFTLKKLDIKKTPVRNYLAYMGFHLCLLQQSFESTIITGSYSVYVWSYMLLGVASMKTSQEHVALPRLHIYRS